VEFGGVEAGPRETAAIGVGLGTVSSRLPSFVRASRVKDGGYSGIGVRDEVWYKHCRI